MAGEDLTVCDALDADARGAARRAMDSLRADDRAQSAQRLVEARIALMRRARVTPSEDLGAGLLAAWLRGLKSPERAAVVRGMDGPTASAVLQRVTRAQPLAADAAQTMTAVVTLTLRCLGRAMTAREWSELIDALAGRAELASEATVRVERALRARGMRAEAAAMARGAMP